VHIAKFTPHIAFTDQIAKITDYQNNSTKRSTRAMMSHNPDPIHLDKKKYANTPSNAPGITDLYTRGDGYKVHVVCMNKGKKKLEKLMEDPLLQEIRDIKYKQVIVKKDYAQVSAKKAAKMKPKDLLKKLEADNLKKVLGYADSD
jgi:hypothetical protein